jgi:hypothetical protein
MWVRKSARQMAGEQSGARLSFRGPAALFFICFLASVASAVGGPRFYANGRWPGSWRDILFGATVIATVAAIAGYFLQLVLRRRLDPWAINAKAVICDACHRVKRRGGQSRCECGGTFEDFDSWTWIDGNGGD